MKIVMYPNSSASKYWRMVDPAIFLNRMGFEVKVIEGAITEEAAQWADVYVLQGIIDKKGLALLHAYQMERGKKLVIEQDDRVEVEDSNPHKKHHDMTNATEIIKTMMSVADMVTTTNKFLARKLSKYNKNVKVIPNYMNMERWDLPKSVRKHDRLRIGWAGSITHLPDLDTIMPVLKRVSKEFPQVEYVFVGDPRLSEYTKELPAEIMLGTPFEAWPAKLHSLNLDIGMAPLRNTDFNKCKSNIKFQEYAIAKIPGVYSHTVYSRRNFDSRKRGLIASSPEMWYACLRNLIVSKALREDVSHSAYTHVRQQYDLKDRVIEWADAFNSLTV